MNEKVYLDSAATTPIDPRAAAAVKVALDAKVGNPASLHAFGRAARRTVEEAREIVAAALHLHPREVIFTASATEANNTAIAGLAAQAPEGRNRVVTSPIEHPAALAPVRRLERAGYVVSWMPVTPSGHVDVEASRELLGPDVALSVLMAVNNETGAIQDVAAWSEACREAGVPLHTDGVQALGRIDVDLPAGVTTAAFSGHKVHGPLGAAVLVVRDGAACAPLLLGGAQERDRRAGTENIPAIAGLAVAVDLAVTERVERTRKVAALDEALSTGLKELDIARNGSGARVSAISSVRFPRPHGETLLMSFDLRGVAVSMGSACSSGAVEPSHVLRAMGLSSAECYGSVRVSLAHTNNEREIERFVAAAREILDASA